MIRRILLRRSSSRILLLRASFGGFNDTNRIRLGFPKFKFADILGECECECGGDRAENPNSSSHSPLLLIFPFSCLSSPPLLVVRVVFILLTGLTTNSLPLNPSSWKSSSSPPLRRKCSCCVFVVFVFVVRNVSSRSRKARIRSLSSASF